MVKISKVKNVLFCMWLLWIFFDIACLILQEFFNFEIVTTRALSEDITNVVFLGLCYWVIKEA